MTAPINLEGRMMNLITALQAYSYWLTDNRVGDKDGPTLDEIALQKWDGLDLDDIERRICEAVEAIDELTGRETERVVAYSLGRIGEPSD